MQGERKFGEGKEKAKVKIRFEYYMRQAIKVGNSSAAALKDHVRDPTQSSPMQLAAGNVQLGYGLAGPRVDYRREKADCVEGSGIDDGCGGMQERKS